MYLKVLFVFFFSICLKDSHAQRSSGGGTFPVYENLGITKVEEYRYNYTGWTSCDSTPSNVKFFNEKGQMTKEVFGSRYNPYYTYKYNNEGFLIDIDTNGLFGYGRAVPLSLKDTLFEQFVIKETWFSIDTIKRLKQSVKYYSNDSLSVKTAYTYDRYGRVIAEIVSSRQNSDPYTDSITITYEYNELDLLQKIVRKDEDQILDIQEFKYYNTN